MELLAHRSVFFSTRKWTQPVRPSFEYKVELENESAPDYF
jgi:hypothetical protein